MLIKTVLGFTFELDVIMDPTGGIELPPWPDRFKATLELLRDDYCIMTYEGATVDGLIVGLVGNDFWSRLVAAHPRDRPGILYLVKDDGMEPGQSIEIEGAFCLAHVLTLGKTIKEVLDLWNYSNSRIFNHKCGIFH